MKTQYGDRWRTFAVVGIGEKTSAPGRYAERVEEIGGDVFAISHRDWNWRTGAAHAQVGVTLTDLERGQLFERGSAGAKQLVRLPREEVPVVLWPPVAVSLRVSVRVAAAGSIANAPELLGPRDRQRPQHHLLHERENRSGGPDAERESQNGCHREGWRLS